MNTETGQHTLNSHSRILAGIFYFACCIFVIGFLGLGIWASVSLNSEDNKPLQEFGLSIHKYPFTHTYVVVSSPDSELLKQKIAQGQLLTVNSCTPADFPTIEKLLSCAKLEQASILSLEVRSWGRDKSADVNRLKSPKPYVHDFWYISIDTFLFTLSFALSLLLFFKTRHYLSGYLISLALLLNVCESRFFFIGSYIFDAVTIESMRLSLAFIVAPLAMYFFPQAFSNKALRSIQFPLFLFCILLMLITYNFLSFDYFIYAVPLTLIVVIIHFVFKYRHMLNTKEKKQVLTMLLCVVFGLAAYFPLMAYGGKYGFLVGRYLIFLSVGFGVFFALMRYGLWQVDSLISKSATLSLLSIIAFSAWAGLDQGLQALLNQTIGLSNTTLTAFLAAAISSLFAVPAYNYISKSCDAFFNKDLHQLKRLLSKEMAVLAEVQALDVFIEQLSTKILSLSGAKALHLEFVDDNHLSKPCVFETAVDDTFDKKAFSRKETFDYQIDNVLSVSLTLFYVERRINRDVKRELEDFIDDIARALASCARWNHLETIHPPKGK